jgi:hypothetical protein
MALSARGQAPIIKQYLKDLTANEKVVKSKAYLAIKLRRRAHVKH